LDEGTRLISLTTPVQAINGTLLRGDTKTQNTKIVKNEISHSLIS